MPALAGRDCAAVVGCEFDPQRWLHRGGKNTRFGQQRFVVFGKLSITGITITDKAILSCCTTVLPYPDDSIGPREV